MLLLFAFLLWLTQDFSGFDRVLMCAAVVLQSSLAGPVARVSTPHIHQPPPAHAKSHRCYHWNSCFLLKISNKVIQKTTQFVTIYTTAVIFYVHFWNKTIIFKKDQHSHFRGSRGGEEAARCGIWLWSTTGLGSSRQSRGMALVWLCCANWLALIKNKMLPQEEIGTNLMKGCPSNLFCPGMKRLEMLFLVLTVTSVSSYPQHCNLFGVQQELDPDKTLAPAHASGEISALSETPDCSWSE